LLRRKGAGKRRVTAEKSDIHGEPSRGGNTESGQRSPSGLTHRGRSLDRTNGGEASLNPTMYWEIPWYWRKSYGKYLR